MIEIRDATTGASVRSWHGHDIDVNDVAFSADGSKLVSAGDDGAARAWDTATREQLWSFQPGRLTAGQRWERRHRAALGTRDRCAAPPLQGHDGLVSGVAFSPDGSRMASSDVQGVVRVCAHDLDDLIDIASAQLTRELTEEECREYLQQGSCT